MRRIIKINGVSRISSERAFVKVTVPESLTPEQECRMLALLTNDWQYYRRLVFLQHPETKAAKKEILEKYPYDGKSTFSELLAKAIENEEC